MDQQILANLINSLSVEQRQTLLQSITPKPVPSIPNPLSTGPTIIPATMTYEHETNHTVTQPIPSPTPTPVQAPTDEPSFHLTGMEQDLATVLKYCVDNKQQTIFTVENTFLQQLLRMMLRVEEKINTLEELITDEVLGYSTPVSEGSILPSENSSRLVFRNDDQKEETSKEERTEEVEEPTQEGNDERVRSSSQKSKGKRRKSKKRRRNRSNSEN